MCALTSFMICTKGRIVCVYSLQYFPTCCPSPMWPWNSSTWGARFCQVQLVWSDISMSEDMFGLLMSAIKLSKGFKVHWLMCTGTAQQWQFSRVTKIQTCSFNCQNLTKMAGHWEYFFPIENGVSLLHCFHYFYCSYMILLLGACCLNYFKNNFPWCF